jgi:hypothetical protein
VLADGTQRITDSRQHQTGRTRQNLDLISGDFTADSRQKHGSNEQLSDAGAYEVSREDASCQWSVASGQLPVVSGQWSVVSFQWSVASFQFSVFSFQFPVVRINAKF